MPKKQKKSFFERLTGSIQEDEQILKKDFNANDDPAPQAKEGGWFKNSVQESEGQLTIDVYQTESDIVIKSTIAGVRPEDIDVNITNDMVTIKGKREKDETVKSENYFYQECYWGAFSRSIILPVEIDAEKATATIKNGILTIRLPKSEKEKTKKIKVKSEL